MRRCALLGLTLIVVSIACRPHQLRNDQSQMRQALLDLYTEQIMDNLIRAHTGMPIVQLDYTNMTGTISQNAAAAYSQDQVLANKRSLASRALRDFTNTVKVGLSGGETMGLTITANPVLNNNEVYNAYLEFLSKPERLQVTCEPPGPCEAHIVRQATLPGCDQKRYFWVPCEYRYDFLRLAMVTTVQRGQPLTTPEYFENTIVSLQDDATDKKYVLLFLKSKLPNDNGTLSFTMDGEAFKLGFRRYNLKLDDQQVPMGRKIDRIRLLVPIKDGKVIRTEMEDGTEVLSKLAPEDFKQKLIGQAVRIDLNYFKPTLPTTEDLIQAIRHEVGLIRLDQAAK